MSGNKRSHFRVVHPSPVEPLIATIQQRPCPVQRLSPDPVPTGPVPHSTDRRKPAENAKRRRRRAARGTSPDDRSLHDAARRAGVPPPPTPPAETPGQSSASLATGSVTRWRAASSVAGTMRWRAVLVWLWVVVAALRCDAGDASSAGLTCTFEDGDECAWDWDDQLRLLTGRQVNHTVRSQPAGTLTGESIDADGNPDGKCNGNGRRGGEWGG